MDFARCTDESKESENLSTKCCSKVETQLEIVELRVPIEPSTPDADRESGDFPSDSKSPITQVVTSKPLLLTCLDSLGERIEAPLESSDSFDPLCSPRTPKDGVFDPFSPAPAHLALAPISRKYFSGSVGFVPRRLQFGSSSSSLQLVEAEEEQSISDSELLEAVYENLLEVIVSHQAESSLAQPSSSQSDSPDCNTPPTSFLSGVAQTCPAAPVKPSRKLRNLDMGLCRKLEF
ncbi:PR domain zinc finger protein 8, putative isoform 1 [Cucumis melo var. makuwa]|nr:PR domain zinc finger protein 8, putative isoform 1 [Cucumis melo var. makuwa]TYK06202.1 PR domain zinc finger protein 8, putative isoform 1 [Cucumis melo var. makuwa]